MAYQVGQSVSGTVSGVTDYGAFVKLDDGSVGMIHISKLSHSFVSDIHSVIKKGDAVTATVIANENGRVALSLIGNGGEKRQNGFDRTVKTKDFESMLSNFKSASDEKLSSLNRDKKRRK